NPDSSKIITEGPQIRIPIQLPAGVLTNETFANDTTFSNAFKGINIRGYSINDDAMLPLTHNSATDGSTGKNGIVVYYTEADGDKGSYRLIYSTRKFTHQSSGFYASSNAG